MDDEARKQPEKNENAANVARVLLDTKSVEICPTKPFRWASGILSPIYTDNRILLGHAEERELIVNAFVEKITKDAKDFDVVIGVATGGIPWAAMIAVKMQKPMAYVRSEPKGYGKGRAIEGDVAKGSKGIIIEDLTSTGGSMMRCIENIKDDVDVLKCYSIFTYELEKSKKRFAEEGLEFEALCGLSYLLRELEARGLISNEQIQQVKMFSEGPEDWANKVGINDE